MPEEILKPQRILPRLRVPLVGIELPELSLPGFPPVPPKLDDRQREVLRHAVLEDLADLVPVAGDALADMHFAEIRRRLRPDEFERFLEDNKALPSGLAVLKTFKEA
ncbi:MAG: hypothetical protein JRD89_07410 [Deltaproteobacteria bacterium]|nr:hypothetical protein [Deltaproteobacteria bacterium]